MTSEPNPMAAGTRSSRRRSTSHRWVIAGLLALGAFPVIAGSLRVYQLASQAPISAENARFFASPVPIVVHIVGASLFTLLGAFQFSPRLRVGRSSWHARSGWLLAPSGLTAGLSGLWMTIVYPRVPNDGLLLDLFRLASGLYMVTSLILALLAIRRRDMAAHGAWMIRGYAIGLGAGTQVLTHLPYFVFVGGNPGELLRALLLGAGWLINALAAEWVIARMRARRALRRSPSPEDRGRSPEYRIARAVGAMREQDAH